MTCTKQPILALLTLSLMALLFVGPKVIYAAGPEVSGELISPAVTISEFELMGNGRALDEACIGSCRIRAQKALRQCLADGGSQERCEARARTLHQDCMTKCQRLKQCGNECKIKARQAIRQCVASGASPERCLKRGRALYQECLKKCERPPSTKPNP